MPGYWSLVAIWVPDAGRGEVGLEVGLEVLPGEEEEEEGGGRGESG